MQLDTGHGNPDVPILEVKIEKYHFISFTRFDKLVLNMHPTALEPI